MTDVIYKWRIKPFIEKLKANLAFDSNKEKICCCKEELKDETEEKVTDIKKETTENIEGEEENFVKKNSENIHSAAKLIFIVDEAHESFMYPYARIIFANLARTARKRNVGMIFSTQTVREFDDYKETRGILKQATVKMICKQDPQDRDWLIKNLDLTPAQARVLTKEIGFNDNDDESTKNAHRGEMCVIDNRNVGFIKVDMIKKLAMFKKLCKY